MPLSRVHPKKTFNIFNMTPPCYKAVSPRRPTPLQVPDQLAGLRATQARLVVATPDRCNRDLRRARGGRRAGRERRRACSCRFLQVASLDEETAGDGATVLSSLQVLVIDEVDKMFDSLSKHAPLRKARRPLCCRPFCCSLLCCFLGEESPSSLLCCFLERGIVTPDPPPCPPCPVFLSGVRLAGSPAVVPQRQLRAKHPKPTKVLLDKVVARQHAEQRALQLVCCSATVGRPIRKELNRFSSLRTNRTRRVLHPVLIGHAASFTPY